MENWLNTYKLFDKIFQITTSILCILRFQTSFFHNVCFIVNSVAYVSVFTTIFYETHVMSTYECMIEFSTLINSYLSQIFFFDFRSWKRNFYRYDWFCRYWKRRKWQCFWWHSSWARNWRYISDMLGFVPTVDWGQFSGGTNERNS